MRISHSSETFTTREEGRGGREREWSGWRKIGRSGLNGVGGWGVQNSPFLTFPFFKKKF